MKDVNKMASMLKTFLLETYNKVKSVEVKQMFSTDEKYIFWGKNFLITEIIINGDKRFFKRVREEFSEQETMNNMIEELENFLLENDVLTEAEKEKKSGIAGRKIDPTYSLKPGQKPSVSDSMKKGLDSILTTIENEEEIKEYERKEKIKSNQIGNIVMNLKPYVSGGTWVFDDPTAELVKEPFVAGIPEIIDKMVEHIPNAEKGISITFSDKPIPGVEPLPPVSMEQRATADQLKGKSELVWIQAESGGNWYVDEHRQMVGWLCPALFKYFHRAPKKLYAVAKPLTDAERKVVEKNKKWSDEQEAKGKKTEPWMHDVKSMSRADLKDWVKNLQKKYDEEEKKSPKDSYAGKYNADDIYDFSNWSDWKNRGEHKI